MDATEICPLTEEAIEKLLSARMLGTSEPTGNGRRRAQRWPFPGTVELWIPGENGVEQYALATSLNLSAHGIGIKSDDALPVDLELAIAIHEPEMSFHGRAIVRHCSEIEGGHYVGLQFKFDKP